MEISNDDIDAVGPLGGSKWFSSQGIGKRGQTVALNFLVNDEDEIPALAQGLGIAHNVHMHKEAEYIGTRDDYLDATDRDKP